MDIDAYEVLQVHQKAELDVIRAAFRTLARKYHPDSGGTGARMASLNEAWAILGDPESRAAHDADLAGATASAQSSTASETREDLHGRRETGKNATRRSGAAAAHEPGRILDFGRYIGWSLRELARHDPIYLEWLERTPIGRPLRSEIQELLAGQAAAATPRAAAYPTKSSSRFGFRGQ
jgi:curved DNA-binding protein CbpA